MACWLVRSRMASRSLESEMRRLIALRGLPKDLSVSRQYKRSCAGFSAGHSLPVSARSRVGIARYPRAFLCAGQTCTAASPAGIGPKRVSARTSGSVSDNNDRSASRLLPASSREYR